MLYEPSNTILLLLGTKTSVEMSEALELPFLVLGVLKQLTSYLQH